MWAAVLSWARAWVSGLVVAVLLAGLVEMVLPRGETRRYVRLVTGLVVLLAVALPLFSLVRMELAPAGGATGQAGTGGLAPPGQPAPPAAPRSPALGALAEFNRRASLSLAQWGLERQVEGMALGSGGVAAARASVQLEGGQDGAPPRVSWVFLQVWPQQAPGVRGIRPIEPVTVGRGLGRVAPAAVGGGEGGGAPVPSPQAQGSGPAGQGAGAGAGAAADAVELGRSLRAAVARTLGVELRRVRVQVEPAGALPAAGSGAGGQG
ncbi:MAG: stage III sporulation protein AF [Acetobacteraceae bacterium]|nr:stage III sporulation protein AF [Acetobacteraceae bacterium]